MIGLVLAICVNTATVVLNSSIVFYMKNKQVFLTLAINYGSAEGWKLSWMESLNSHTVQVLAQGTEFHNLSSCPHHVETRLYFLLTVNFDIIIQVVLHLWLQLGLESWSLSKTTVNKMPGDHISLNDYKAALPFVVIKQTVGERAWFLGCGGSGKGPSVPSQPGSQSPLPTPLGKVQILMFT